MQIRKYGTPGLAFGHVRKGHTWLFNVVQSSMPVARTFFVPNTSQTMSHPEAFGKTLRSPASSQWTPTRHDLRAERCRGMFTCRGGGFVATHFFPHIFILRRRLAFLFALQEWEAFAISITLHDTKQCEGRRRLVSGVKALDFCVFSLAGVEGGRFLCVLS